MGYRIKITIPVSAEKSMEERDLEVISMARTKFNNMGLWPLGNGQVLQRLVFDQDEIAVCEHLVEIGS